MPSYIVSRMENVTTVQDHIVLAACALAGTQGWSQATVRQAAVQAGYTDAHIRMVFPNGLRDVLTHFSGWADRHMLPRLADIPTQDMGVRARIHCAVMTRWDILEQHKDAVASASRYYTVPWHMPTAQKALWQTADTIWTWAGDASTDYNFYTKRTLLAGVLAVATPVWLRDDRDQAAAFLSRRLDNVVNMGRTIGQVMQKCSPKGGMKNAA